MAKALRLANRGGAAARLIGACTSGAALALALAPFHFIWLVPLCLGLIGRQALSLEGWKQGAFYGWLLGTSYFAVAMVWIYEPFQIDAERYAWMAPFAVVGLAAGLALFWAAAFAVATKWGRGAARILVLIATLSLAEFGRAYLLTGLPWAAFAQFWIDTPVAQMLPLIGPHGVAVLTLIAFLPLGLLSLRPVLAVLPLAATALCVALVPSPPAVEMTGKIIRLVQPNAPQDEKWHPDLRWSFVQRQVEYTSAPGDVDLIVWPETAVPLMLHYAEDVLTQISAAAGQTPLFLGIQRREAGQYFNSAILLEEGGAPSQIYDKAHLVPFGEYVPAGNLMARFGIHGFASQAGAGYAAGPGPQVIDLPIGKALPLICYEAVFPQDVNAAPERADVLIQITNDAWFGTYSGPFQHLVQARMRALEQGLPMVRVANTGISAMIDPYGRIVDSLPLGVAGYIDVPLPAPLAPTLYARTGDIWVFLFCILLCVGGMAFSQSIARRS